MQILIPMAGQGQRFTEAGYETHKPVLPTFDRHTGKKIPMVVCATGDLPGIEENGKNITFIDRTFHKEDGVEDTIKKHYPSCQFINVENLTEGQACTCMLAEESLNMDDELLIAGCDNGMICDNDKFNTLRHECDVIVFTYRNNEAVLKKPDAYGWMITDSNNDITGLSIKKAISDDPMRDHAVVATFWFKKASIFVEATKKMIAEDDRINGEFYVDETIKHVMELGYHAKVFEIDRYICWGTPDDYEEYQLTYEYWKEFADKIDISSKKINPFTIGIAGDSGSGKSTLLSVFKKMMDDDDLLILEGDGEHKWERGSTQWQTYSHLDADANKLYFQANNLQLLKNGSSIKRRDYDHTTGLFTNEILYNPKKFVVLCGLHSFLLPQNRKNLDLMIFMDIDSNLRKYWKIKRDVTERGHDIPQVIKSISDREKDGIKYIEPQKEYADIRIRYFDPNLTSYTNIDYEESVLVELCLKREDMVCGYVQKAIKYLEKISSDISISNNKICFGESDVSEVSIPIYAILEKFGISTGNYSLNEDTILKGKDGIVAFIIVCCIEEKMKND